MENKTDKMRLKGKICVHWIYFLVIISCVWPKTDGDYQSKRMLGCMPQYERTAYACEDVTLMLQCQKGVIRVSRAVYGRFSFDYCNERKVISGWDTQCMALNSTRIVAERCDGRPRCNVLGSNSVFGDPCKNTPKYLQGVYCCEEEKEPETEAPSPTTTPPTTTTPTTTTNTTTTTSTTTEAQVTSLPPRTPTHGADVPTPSQKPITKSPVTARFCPDMELKGVFWPKTRVGQVVSRPCQGDKQGMMTWRCGAKGWAGLPDTTNCVSQWVDNLEDKIEESGDVTEAVEELSEQTAQKSMGAGDLKKTTKTIFPKLNKVLKSQLTASSPEQKSKVIKKFTKAMVKTGSNLLSRKQSESWRELPSAERSVVATSITVNMEETGFEIAANLAVDESVITEDENILLEVSVVGVKDNALAEVTFPSKATSGWDQKNEKVTIPMESLRSRADAGHVKVVFLVYQNLDEWMNPDSNNGNDGETVDSVTMETVKYNVEEKEVITMEEKKTRGRHINTKIFSASINSRRQKMKLKEPFTFTMRHKETPTDSEIPICSYWDFNDSLSGEWSSSGCSVVTTGDISTTCQCNHLTNFAVLMDVAGTELAPEHELALMAITYIGCIISIVCLFCSFFTFCFFKNLQCDRNTIHKNLVLCLMLAEIVFILGISLTQNKIVCAVVAGLLHFLFLASFSWMCLEGVQLYVMLIEVFEAERSRRKWYYLVGYGIPTVIVGVAAGVEHTGYGTEKHCWLRTDTAFIWSFVGPVIAVVFVNIIMLSIAVYMMCKHANTLASSLRTKEKSRLQKVSGDPHSGSSSGSTSYMMEERKRTMVEIPAWIKGAVVLVVLLGLTWVFGFMYVNEESVAMAYVFTVLNTLQGLFIFLFHCLMNEKVKKEYKKCAYRSTWLPSCFRNICVGYSGSMSHSPNNHSSSSGGHLLKFWSGRRRKSSSSTLEKGHKGKYRRSDPRSDSEFFTSKDTNSVFTRNGSGRNSKQSDRTYENGNAPIYHEIDGLVGDLSVMDCSVIDTEFVSEYCQNQMQVSMETRRYSSGSEDDTVPADDGTENKNRLSVLSDDSAIKNSDFASSEADAGDLSYSEMSDDDSDKLVKVQVQDESEVELLITRTDSERNLLNNLHQYKLNCDADGKKIYPGSISEIYLYQDCLSSGEDLNRSSPCIKFTPGKTKSLESDVSGDSQDPLLSSLPQLRIVEDKDFEYDQSQVLSHSMDLRPMIHSQRRKQKLNSANQGQNSPEVEYHLDYSEC